MNVKQLKQQLAMHKKVTPRKSYIPVTGNVRLTKSGDRLTIHSTDLETHLVTRMECDDGVDYDVCVELKQLIECVELFTDTVYFEVADSTLRIYLGAVALMIDTEAAEDFPNVPPPCPGDPIALATNFVENLTKLAPFVSNDENRPAFQCIHVTPNLCESTNGRTVMQIVEDTGLPEVLVPGTKVPLIEKLAPARFNYNGMWTEWHTENATLIMKNVDYRYPDTQRFFEADHEEKGTAYITQKAYEQARKTIGVLLADFPKLKRAKANDDDFTPAKTRLEKDTLVVQVHGGGTTAVPFPGLDMVGELEHRYCAINLMAVFHAVVERDFRISQSSRKGELRIDSDNIRMVLSRINEPK